MMFNLRKETPPIGVRRMPGRTFSTSSNPNGPLEKKICTDIDVGNMDIEFRRVNSLKKFGNPNFVNKNNPLVHSCQNNNHHNLESSVKGRSVNSSESLLKEALILPRMDFEECSPKKEYIIEPASADNVSSRLSSVEEDKICNAVIFSENQSSSDTLSSVGKKSQFWIVPLEDDDSTSQNEESDSDGSTSEEEDVSNLKKNLFGARLQCLGYPNDSDIVMTSGSGDIDLEDFLNCCSTDSELEEDEDLNLTDLEESDSEEERTIDEVDFAQDHQMPARTTKVRFSDVVETHTIIAWRFAYAQARKGLWEQYMRDGDRFRRRCDEAAGVLNSVLDSAHRARVFSERFS